MKALAKRENKMLNKKINVLEKYDEFILFGASNLGEIGFEFLKENKKKVLFFCDNDNFKWGNSFLGKDIISPADLLSYSKDYPILITSIYRKEIFKQLESMGVDIKRILVLVKGYKNLASLLGTDSRVNENYKVLSYLKFIEIEKYIEGSMKDIINEQHFIHKKALEQVKLKSKNREIKVVFFALLSSVWKYEEVYRLFEADKRFNPVVLVCPIVNNGREYMLESMEQSYKYFKNNGYNVVNAYDVEMDNYLNVKKEINPDIIFYTNPYLGLIDNRYYVTEFTDVLTCYVNYAYQVTIYEKLIFTDILPNLVWKFFLETKIHYDNFYNVSMNQAINGVVTGYPGVDSLKYGIREENSCWKIKAHEIKRIIWAPHHTIYDNFLLTYSNFLSYYDRILELAEKYRDKIQISFKPHPLLKTKLYNHKDWGKERTDEYYNKWKYGENTQLHTDSYVDLFNSSDALIHDSGSFTAEYLHCGKPLLFTMKENIEEQFNSFGKITLQHHYYAYTAKDIERFIVDIVINNNDYMKEKRDNLYKDTLILNNQNTASNNIYNYICKEIFEINE